MTITLATNCFLPHLMLRGLCPIRAIERAVLNRFGKVACFEAGRLIEIGDGARDFQDAVVCARGEAHARNGIFQHFLALVGDGAEFPDQFRRHLRVGEDFLLARESVSLALAGSQHALSHRGGVFRGGCSAELLVLHSGHFDVDIDAVDQGPGNFRNVALNLRWRAVALARRVAEKSAGTRIHRRGKHESRREGHRSRRAGYRHGAIFPWLYSLRPSATTFNSRDLMTYRSIRMSGHSAASRARLSSRSRNSHSANGSRISSISDSVLKSEAAGMVSRRILRKAESSASI